MGSIYYKHNFMQTISLLFMEGIQNDSGAPVQEVSTQNMQQEVAPSIADFMAFAFQEQMPSPAVVAAPTADVSPVLDANLEPAPDAAPLPDNVAADVSAIDQTDFLRNNFGIEDVAAIKAALDEYQLLKQTAQSPAEYKYASDEAKRLAHAINSGDFKTVKSYAEAQELNIEGMTSEAQLKTYLKLQNPLFDQELIDDEYKSLYSINEEDEKYQEDPIQLRKDKLRLQQRQQNDLEKAKDYFAQYKQKIQLPEIQSAAKQDSVVDEAYEAYKASTAQATDDFNNKIVPAINALKESDVPFTVNINDPNGQMQFAINLTPEKADFDKAKNAALNFSGWVNESFYDENGNFQPTKLQKTILLAQNFDKYAQSIARQAVNAERKRTLEKETSTPSIERNFTTAPEKTELQKQFDMAFAV